MSAKVKIRKFHRAISPWLVPSLLLLAVTGLIYRIGRAWFGMTKETGNKILHLHSGAWLGESGSVIYLILVGSLLLFLTISGLYLWFFSKSGKAQVRKSHRVIGIVMAIPLGLSAITDMAYQAGEKWFHFSKETMSLLMSLHQGSWLGPDLRPFYILLIGLGLIGLCLTGVSLWL